MASPNDRNNNAGDRQDNRGDNRGDRQDNRGDNRGDRQNNDQHNNRYKTQPYHKNTLVVVTPCKRVYHNVTEYHPNPSKNILKIFFVITGPIFNRAAIDT